MDRAVCEILSCNPQTAPAERERLLADWRIAPVQQPAIRTANTCYHEQMFGKMFSGFRFG